MTKRCPRCKKMLSIGRFWEQPSGTRATYCVSCTSYRASAYKARKKYGITLEQLAELRKIAECMVCGHRPAGQSLDLDHCHETMRVRGALCRRCNNALGMVRDDPDTLRKLADYLETNAAGLPTLYQ